jgi:N utilization substance protein B
MMGRHELREQVFRLLFRVEFNSAVEMEEQKTLFLEDLPAEDTEHAAEEKSAVYIAERCGKIQEKLTEIDRMINDNTEGWDTTRMGKVELTVLRLGVYEICFDEDIPDSVAINEAVEIAKKYGQEASGGFVNAILAKIVKTGESNS